MEEKIKKLLFSCNPINIELAFTISKETEEIALKEFKELINFIESKSLNIKYSNKIKYFIKKAIKDLILRKYITFGNTNIKKLPNNIGILKNLEILSIPCNELTELPDSFENLQSLFKLNLCYNNFIKFPKVLFKLKKLNYLHLDGNNISEKEILKFSSKFPECFVTFDDKYGNNRIL